MPMLCSLCRGQRKRLLNKTHVMAKKSDMVLKLLKGEKDAKQLEWWYRFLLRRSMVMSEIEKNIPESQASANRSVRR